MDKLSVGMVSPYFVKCGIATYSQHLNPALANLGCEVLGIKLPRFGYKSPKILQDIAERIPIDKVDLVHVQHEYGLYQTLEGGFFGYLKQLGKPLVTTMHAVGASFEIDNIVANASNKVIVHNKFCARVFKHPSVIIPHGTCFVSCPPKDECKGFYGINTLIPVVGYCGFLSRYKGLEDLIMAMSEIKDVGLLIGGGWHTSGAESQYIYELKQYGQQKLGNRCQWVGFVPDEKLATLYGLMDLVVYPSKFSTESGALLMAISHGKAVLASNLAPMKEKEEEGALMTFNDTKDLAEKIQLLLRDEEQRHRLEEGAKKYAIENDWSVVAQKHIELYEKVLAG